MIFKCEKCASELEPSAKFCTNCGEKVSENIKTEIKNEQPSSKVKTWVLKTVAFLIALFVFTLARVIFTVINGVSMDGKLQAGGILLFIGVYMLLKGLFLKDISAKKTGGWILGAYIVLSIAFTYYMNNSDYGLESQIINMQKKTPIRISDETIIQNINLKGENINIEYKLIKHSINDLDNIHKKELKKDFCKEEDIQKMFVYDKSVYITIYDKYNKEITNLFLTKNRCKHSKSFTRYNNKNVSNKTEKKSNLLDKYSITVITDLEYANVKILNIKERYYDGIKLPKGSYIIQVSKVGYKTKTFTVNLEDSNYTKYVILEKIKDIYVNNSSLNNANIKKFIENYLWKMGSGFYFNRLYLIKNSFAKKVKYYSWGEVSSTKVSKDKVNYLERWSYLKYKLIKMNSIAYSHNNDKVKINFTASFKNWSFKRKGIQGEANYVLKVDTSTWKIIAEESNVYSKKDFNPSFPTKNSLPFIGTKRFNFYGKHDGWNSITIDKNGMFEFLDYGKQNIENLKPNGVIFIGNQLCDKSMNLCTELEDN